MTGSTLGDPYITGEQLKNYLRITDSNDDVLIAQAVRSASRAIEQYCHRQFNHDDGTPTARHFKAQDLVTCNMLVNGSEVSDPTTISILVDVAQQGQYTSAWSTPHDFVTMPFDGIRNGVSGWPTAVIKAVGPKWFPVWDSRPRVQVTAAWGWLSVPDDVVTACYLKAAKVFGRKDSPQGISAGGFDIGAVRISRYEDPEIVMLLNDYVAGSEVA